MSQKTKKNPSEIIGLSNFKWSPERITICWYWLLNVISCPYWQVFHNKWLICKSLRSNNKFVLSITTNYYFYRYHNVMKWCPELPKDNSFLVITLWKSISLPGTNLIEEAYWRYMMREFVSCHSHHISTARFPYAYTLHETAMDQYLVHVQE